MQALIVIISKYKYSNSKICCYIFNKIPLQTVYHTYLENMDNCLQHEVMIRENKESYQKLRRFNKTKINKTKIIIYTFIAWQYKNFYFINRTKYQNKI